MRKEYSCNSILVGDRSRGMAGVDEHVWNSVAIDSAKIQALRTADSNTKGGSRLKAVQRAITP